MGEVGALALQDHGFGPKKGLCGATTDEIKAVQGVSLCKARPRCGEDLVCLPD